MVKRLEAEAYYVFDIGEIAFHLDRTQLVHMGDTDSKLTVPVEAERVKTA